MREKLILTVVAALVGGVVGACAVFFLTGRDKFESLVVGNLTITGQATLLNADRKEGVILKEGSVLANNMVLGNNIVGTQFQGRVFVGNRMYTSPDDLVATPVEQWRFFTEIGCSPESGGEMLIRSPNGANVLGLPVNSGVLLRAGFDKEDRPQMFAQVNQDGTRLPVPFQRPVFRQAASQMDGQESPTLAAEPGTKTQ